MQKLLATLDEIKDQEPKKFKFMKGDIPVDCFLLEFEGEIIAYRNQCRHEPISLDIRGNGKFWDEERKQLSCRHHGAIYNPVTGECTGGPCPGAHLKRIPIRIDGDKIYLDR